MMNHLTVRISLLACLQGIMAVPAYTADTNKYFKSQESTYSDTQGNISNNRDGSNPIITVRQFDISSLEEIPEYGIYVSDIDKIIKENRKQNNNRYDINRLNVLSEKLTQYYRQNGLILAKVYLPPQSLKDYILKFEVVLGEISNIKSDDNEYYSDLRLHRPFQDLVNKPAYIPTLESSLIELKEYPGVDLVTRFSEGKKIGQTEIEILVKEEKGTDFSIALDNYGSDYTGIYRGTLKGNFYNVADQADRLSVNLLATLDPSNALFGGINYRFKVAPYFNESSLGNAFFRHGLNITVAYQESQFTVGEEFEDLDIKGEAATTSIGVDKDLILRNRHRLNTGFTLSTKNAKTSTQGETTKEDNISIFSWSTHYKWNDRLGGSAANLISFSIHQGLPEFLGAMEQDDPNTSRNAPVEGGDSTIADCQPGSDVSCAPLDFTKYNLSISRNQQMGLYWLMVKLRHQETSQIMLASEQYNLGGARSVRGFSASDFSADRATVGTIEYSGTSNARKYSIPISNLKLAGFIDYGVGERLQPFDNENAFSHMLSVGGYAQFIKDKSFSTKLEIAIPMTEVEGQETEDFEILFNMERGF